MHLQHDSDGQQQGASKWLNPLVGHVGLFAEKTVPCSQFDLLFDGVAACRASIYGWLLQMCSGEVEML